MSTACVVCAIPAMVLYVNTLLDKGLSNAAIARGVVDMGGKLDPERIARHKRDHWVKPVVKDGPQPTKRDLAILVADKTYDMVDGMTPDALMVFGKDVAPIIGRGLAAQALIDKREVNDRKLGIAAGALSLQVWLAGLGDQTKPPAELDDGLTIDGDAVEVHP